jgi:hypothetical protein
LVAERFEFHEKLDQVYGGPGSADARLDLAVEIVLVESRVQHVCGDAAGRAFNMDRSDKKIAPTTQVAVLHQICEEGQPALASGTWLDGGVAGVMDLTA